MEHHAVAEVVGLLRGNDTAQLLLHLQGILAAVGKTQTAGDADAVGVAHIAVGAVDIAQDQVGGLAAYAGQGEKVIHVVRHPAAEALHQHLRCGHDIAGFGAPEAAGMDIGAHLVHIGGGEGLQRGVAGEQGGRDQIHAGIGTLGGQTDGEQKLVILLIVQRAQRVRVQLLQRRDDGGDLLFRLHVTSPRAYCIRCCRKRQSVV